MSTASLAPHQPRHAAPATGATPAVAPLVAGTAAAVRRVARGRVTLGRVVNSEWIKIRSVRSTIITLLAAAGAVVALGLLFCGVSAGRIGGQAIGFSSGDAGDPVGASLGGVDLGQLVVGVLGVILVTGEYSTGMIRSTLASVPRRLPVLWAKAIVFGGVTMAAMLAAAFAAFLGGQAVLGSAGAALTDGGVLRTVVGAAVYLTGIGLLGLAAGAIARGTASAIAVLFAVTLVVPGLFPLLPHGWNSTVGPYLPSNAGSAFMTVTQHAGTLAPWTGLAVFAGYVVAALAGAAILLKRRDA